MRPFRVIDAPQRSQEWFAARLGRLTASNAKHITSTLKSGGEPAARRDLRMQLVCERLTGQPQDDVFVNEDMQRGIDLEPAAFAAYEATSGTLVSRVGFLADSELMAGASPDGVVNDFAGLLEIKCPRPANHVGYLRAGGIPAGHRAQLLHQMWLTGAGWLDFVSYCPALPASMQVYIARLVREDDEIAAHEAAVRKFLAEVDTEEAALRGWSVIKETA
jgi:putative phage-type endonuclease